MTAHLEMTAHMRCQGHAVADWPYNTARWQKLRRIKLLTDPLCYACLLMGRVVAAVAVDHIKAINQGGDPFPALDQLMSLCTSCHSHKTNAADRLDRQSSARRFVGFDLQGNPIDPSDDWFTK